MTAGKRTTLEDFLERAFKLHGDKYDYSRITYIKNINQKIEIYCKSCQKYFSQTVASHLHGYGCRKCALKKPKITFEEFEKRAKEIHGEQYLYIKEHFSGFGIKTKIYCKYHDEYFEQTPTQHIHAKSGCPRCYLSKTTKDIILTTDDFKKRAWEIHGAKYNYSKVNYVNNNTYVEIICPYHGSFSQIPRSHIYSGAGCMECGLQQMAEYNNKRKADTFIERANKVHDNKYDYSKCVYVRADQPVEIICKKHGSFWQEPTNHLYGNGCPGCWIAISNVETAWLDSINIPRDPIHRNVSMKVNGRQFRFDGFDPNTNTIYEFNGDYYHGNPEKYDSDILNKVTHCTFGELYRRTLNKEAWLKSAGYNVISIWESDFKRNKELILSNIVG